MPDPRSAVAARGGSLGRRAFLARLAAGVPATILAGGVLGVRGARAATAPPGADAGLAFARVAPADHASPHARDALVVPAGYVVDMLARWGDAIADDAPSLGQDAPGPLAAADQRRQIGFNCDFLAFFPLVRGRSDRGLLCINHEYTTRSEMFAPEALADGLTAAIVDVELAAHGMSIVEVARDDGGRWRLVRGSPYNRRITGTTAMTFGGPAAGDARLGASVPGMLGNCAGGKTPWGTVLTGEENIQAYFGNGAATSDPWQREANRMFSIRDGASVSRWESVHPRFDLAAPGNEHAVNGFGWVVEIDPFDPASTPRKRTALGRFRHEGATTQLSADRRLVVYMGDDTRGTPTDGGFLFKFVSRGRYDPWDRAANRDLIDEGVLFVARLDGDGRGRWLPLVPAGPLASATQAQILIDARGAALALGATPLDRPEDVEAHPFTQAVYVALTNHSARGEGVHPANARAHNRHGHVLEIVEDGGDLAAMAFSWEIFFLGGDPAQPEHGAWYPTRAAVDTDASRAAGAGAGASPNAHANATTNASADALDPLACPDNLAFDPRGHLWIATDGQPGTLGQNDALYAIATSGPDRARPRRFLTGPAECEICGPEFTPDGATLFVSVQHPGEEGGLATPTSRWPDGTYPRPSVVAIRREDGGIVGS